MDASDKTEPTDKHIVVEIDSDEDEFPFASLENETAKSQEQDAYDKQFLHRVIEDAGRQAFGIILTELWVLDDTGTRLFRPDCGWWMDHYAANEACSRLTDSSLPDYIPADPCPPGIGLPGYLWSQATTHVTKDRAERRSTVSRQSGFRNLDISRHSTGRISMFRGGIDGLSASNRFSMLRDAADRQFGLHRTPRTSKLAGAVEHQFGHSKLSWCEVKPLANDPHQPYCERTQYLAKVGLGLAAGVTFNMAGTRGIVVYMVRDTADLNDLTDCTNEEYLQRATSVIGSTYSLRRARLAVVRKRKRDIDECWRLVRNKLLAIRFHGLSLAGVVQREEMRKGVVRRPQTNEDVVYEIDGTVNKVSKYFKAKMKQEAKKFMGAKVKAPPPFGWSASLFTFMGCFITFVMLTNLSKAMAERFGSEFAIELPPFGALMGLHYGLTSAPASQPRNAIVGQILGLTIAVMIGNYLDVELWLRQSLAIASSIGVMVKCGVIHPPAGAAAVLFSSGKFSWIQVGMMLVGNVLTILTSTLINNWNDQRQFPTFWGFRPINDFVSFAFGEKKGKKK